MTPEAALHLAKAQKLIETARQLLRQGFANDAARDAYLAAFHAAQAYIVDHAGRAAKTHSGAHTQFAQLALHDPRIDEEMRSFLPKAFRLKAIADYEFGEDAEIPPHRAEAAVTTSERFVGLIEDTLRASESSSRPETAPPT